MLWVGITTSTYSSSYDFMSFTRFTIHELIQSYVVRVIIEIPFWALRDPKVGSVMKIIIELFYLSKRWLSVLRISSMGLPCFEFLLGNTAVMSICISSDVLGVELSHVYTPTMFF